MSTLSDIIQKARAASTEFDLSDLEVAATAALKDYWGYSPHSAMEYIESCASAFTYERARRIVREVTLHWSRIPGYSWSSGGNADHCFLSALLLTANYDLVAEAHFEKCWESVIGKAQDERYFSRMREPEQKLESLRRAEALVTGIASPPVRHGPDFGKESGKQEGGPMSGESFDTGYLASQLHQREALLLHRRIVAIFGGLAALCVLGGIAAIILNSISKTEFKMFGVTLSTGHVGVAFVSIGLLTAFFTVRLVLKNQYDLAALPPDRSNRRRKRAFSSSRNDRDAIKDSGSR